jgi:hypothetical protein
VSKKDDEGVSITANIPLYNRWPCLVLVVVETSAASFALKGE